MTIRHSCKEGVCAKCKYWKILDSFSGLKGKCSKNEYIISCSHSCCDDFKKE